MKNHSCFIDVILPIPLQKLFTYGITHAEYDFLKRGMRVAVPFGKTKIYTAIVYNLHYEKPKHYEVKDIHQILDEQPIITENQLEFWLWISNYYMCTLGDVLRAALPSAFLLESETEIKLCPQNKIKDTDLKDEEFLVFEALNYQSSLKVDEVCTILDKKHVLPILKKMLEKGVIIIEEKIYSKYKPKQVRYVKVADKYSTQSQLHDLLDKLKRAPKQTQIILSYFSLSNSTKKPIKVSRLLNKSKASSSQLNLLVEKKILEIHYLQEDRIQTKHSIQNKSIDLNNYQKEALDKIRNLFKKHEVTLLKGVTSSGKTEIYVKLIEEILKNKKQVLYLVPEIALTSQLVRRLQHYFVDKVAVYHSKYSINERVEVWNHCLNKSNKAQIILGARSSVFLPFQNLGLVIIDEEHEQSYKQFDPAPRYHARDAAIVLSGLFKAKVILGTATPSIESYYNAIYKKKYGLVELNYRFNNVLMPEIELVDLKDKYRRKNMKGHFSDRLIEELTLALENNQQAILFQNRRGYSPIIECKTCGQAPQCPNCDVSLTFHQYKNELRCHYCGYKIAMQEQCFACGSLELDSKGFGTEQIQTEAKELFPNAKIARMDLDTTRGKYAYERLINKFEQHDIDILIGTQMLTKGLDFRKVKVVGIMNADNMLNFPDFRAHERSFQLMQQVAGRAGRTKDRGKVLIQTYNPLHNIVQQVSSNNYELMYKEQLNDRHNYKYPPLFRLIKITFKHRDFNKVNEGADWFAKYLKTAFKQFVLGPEFPPIARVRNQYQKDILVKIPPKDSLLKTKKYIIKIKNSFHSIQRYRAIRVVLNVDNY